MTQTPRPRRVLHLGHVGGWTDPPACTWLQGAGSAGDVLDMAHRFADQFPPLDHRTRRLLVWLANEAADTWDSPDAGMWEARDRQRHYLSSKVMCWVALDRAVKLSGSIGDDHLQRWAAERDQIRATVLEQGWNEDVGAFTGAFGSEQLDASVLVLPLVGFLPAHDERMAATIAAVERNLVRNGLVYRWEGDTNGFVLCTYWLVECLVLAANATAPAPCSPTSPPGPTTSGSSPSRSILAPVATPGTSPRPSPTWA